MWGFSAQHCFLHYFQFLKPSSNSHFLSEFTGILQIINLLTASVNNKKVYKVEYSLERWMKWQK